MTEKDLHKMVEGMEKAIRKLKAEVAEMDHLLKGIKQNMEERSKIRENNNADR